jgi:predicted RNase H-like nuclease
VGGVGRSVLGIDAAWTDKQPSGVALVVEEADGWRLLAVEESYHRFLGVEGMGSRLPDVPALLAACVARHGAVPDLVTVDMPLSRAPITGRRASDNAITSAYGARGCGTHSPSALRPGPISDALRRDFGAAGYSLLAKGDAMPARALVEVYPHPALVELTGDTMRLRYKLARSGKYWPELPLVERRARVMAEWERIVGLLDHEIAGVAAQLPLPPPEEKRLAVLKGFEDRLDAVVCAWIGTRVLAGDAVAYGDALSAIWVPRPR